MATMEISKPAVRAEAPQMGWVKILWMFAWPAAWYTLLIYVLGRSWIPAGGSVPTWYLLTVMALGGGAELAVGLILLRKEGHRLSLNALRDRLRLRWPKGWKNWALAAIVLLLGLSLSMAMAPLNGLLATVSGFVPPAWWPPASNPTVAVNSVADAFPDVNLTGNALFVSVYFVIGLVFNIFGEEIYYRGYLLPKMRGVFGRADWVANGLLFTLKHIYQRWMFPGLLVGNLCFAFAAGPLGSLPLALIYHWVGNYLMQMVFLVQAAMRFG